MACIRAQGLYAWHTVRILNVVCACAQVAVKVIRANEVMFKAGQTETVILRKLSGADPEGKRHVVRLLRTFEYRQHLCLVFENMVRASVPFWCPSSGPTAVFSALQQRCMDACSNIYGVLEYMTLPPVVCSASCMESQ